MSKKFVAHAEMLGATAARALTAEDLKALSPSLGRPSDIALVWDGVSIGAKNFSRHESLYLIGAVHFQWPRCSTGGV